MNSEVLTTVRNNRNSKSIIIWEEETKTPPPLPSKGKRCLLFFIGCLECALFGGAVFGWPQLVYDLKKNGIFSHLCFPKNNSGEIHLENSTVENYNYLFYNTTTLSFSENVLIQCDEQDDRFSLIYTIAVSLYGIPGIFIGILLQYAGLVVTRVFAGLLVATSFLCLAQTTVDSPHWLWPFMLLLSISGNTIRMAVTQLSDLFPEYRTTAMNFILGIYAFSSALFLLFQVLEEAGLNQITVYYSFSILGLVSAILSLLTPLHGYQHYRKGTKALKEQLNATKDMRSISYILCSYSYIVGLFSLNSYQGYYNVWITGVSDSEKDVKILSTYFSVASLFSGVLSPIGGFITDLIFQRAKKRSKKRDLQILEVQSFFWFALLTISLNVALYFCLFFSSYHMVIVSLFFLSFVRPNVISVPFAFLRARFPKEHFFLLMGVMCTISSCFGLLQHSHFRFIQTNYYLAHGVLITFLHISLSFPIHMLKEDLISDSSKKELIDVSKEKY